MDELILLNRIRVDIGNVSGSLGELLQYAGMAGFNDNYEPQTKPRLVGTWTITDYYTPAQLAQAQATFDGLTIVGDPNYALDFSQMAVQVLDPNEDNYNPAVAIILQGQNVGTTMTSAPLGHGKWFLTKTQAAAITSMITGNIPWFYIKSTVVDSNGIVTSDASISYDFSSFDEFQYFGVTSVGTYYFVNCSKLVSIVLPNNVTLIGDNAFNGDTSLENVTLPNTLTTINYRAFFQCKNLKHINLPQSLVTIGNDAFYLASSAQTLTSEDFIDLNLPNITSIGGACFYGCKIVKNIVNLGSITAISTNCFSAISAVSVVLPNTVTSIGEGAFYGCSSLETITLSSGLLTIGKNAFRNCTNLKMPTLPTSITTIGQYAFLNACAGTPTQNELVDINLPNLTTFSSSDASPISSNKYIRKIISLGSITSLGGDFGGCTNLIEATLPSTITTFSKAGLFNGIAANAIIHLLSETPITIPNSIYIFKPSSVKVYVGDGSSSTHDDAILADYLAASNWSYYSSQLDTWYNYLHPQS